MNLTAEQLEKESHDKLVKAFVSGEINLNIGIKTTSKSQWAKKKTTKTKGDSK